MKMIGLVAAAMILGVCPALAQDAGAVPKPTTEAFALCAAGQAVLLDDGVSDPDAVAKTIENICRKELDAAIAAYTDTAPENERDGLRTFLEEKGRDTILEAIQRARVLRPRK